MKYVPAVDAMGGGVRRDLDRSWHIFCPAGLRVCRAENGGLPGWKNPLVPATIGVRWWLFLSTTCERARHHVKPRNSKMQEKPMSSRKATFLVLGAAVIALAAAVPKLAVSAPERTQLGPLSGNEGIYVNTKSFGIVKGAAKAEPTEAQLMKLGAKEVKDGAIIFRVGDKLYLVDTDPNAKSMYGGWAAEAFSGGA
jgi:hypothetical protein